MFGLLNFRKIDSIGVRARDTCTLREINVGTRTGSCRFTGTMLSPVHYERAKKKDLRMLCSTRYTLDANTPLFFTFPFH
jgi:hypothetical protein